MRIAITADNHLTSRDQHPERFEALENLLADIREQEIDTLIIAGDLFDADRPNYAEFEALCGKPEYQGVNLFIIPGNHDPAIDGRKIVAGNVTIIDEPTILLFDDRPFFFLPYRKGQTMGEPLAAYAGELPAGEWVLVAHGDWSAGLRTPNPMEPGVYMPLTRRDVELRRPARVFLGHIHLAMDAPPVHYVGSPCGLDISETGRRRCLVYDTDSDQITARPVDTPVIYHDESFLVMPAAGEVEQLKRLIESRKKGWGLPPQLHARVQLRVSASGYSANRAALRAVLDSTLAGYHFYKGQAPDISGVNIADDVDRGYIVEQVRERLERLTPSGDEADPSPDEIMLHAMHIIYGG